MATPSWLPPGAGRRGKLSVGILWEPAALNAPSPGLGGVLVGVQSGAMWPSTETCPHRCPFSWSTGTRRRILTLSVPMPSAWGGHGRSHPIGCCRSGPGKTRVLSPCLLAGFRWQGSHSMAENVFQELWGSRVEGIQTQLVSAELGDRETTFPRRGPAQAQLRPGILQSRSAFQAGLPPAGRCSWLTKCLWGPMLTPVQGRGSLPGSATPGGPTGRTRTSKQTR